MRINPIELKGVWDEGYALDYHTVKSIPIGEDPFGHMQFDTTYTSIGEVLNKFKYKNQYDYVDTIVDVVDAFLKDHPQMRTVQTILPAPPSNKSRVYQPAFEIGELLARRLQVYYSNDVLEKITESEYKNLPASEKQSMHGMIKKRKRANRSIDVLLIDDIYQSGSTLRQCTEVLREDPNINIIYVLTITKTRK